jgi:hypothetical protein
MTVKASLLLGTTSIQLSIIYPNNILFLLILKISIDSTKGFHCGICIHVCNKSNSPITFLTSLPHFKVLVGFIMLFSYIHYLSQYPFPLPLHAAPPSTWLCLIILGLDSTSEIIRYLSLWTSFTQCNGLQFHSFSFFLLLNVLQCICVPQFNHSLVVRYLSWFHNLAIVNRAVINVDVQVSLWCACLHSFR